jgi:hypothetical protein
MYDPDFGHKIGRQFVARFGVHFSGTPLTPFLDWSMGVITPDRPAHFECHVQATLWDPSSPAQSAWRLDVFGTEVEAALYACYEHICHHLAWFEKFANPETALATVTQHEYWLASEEPEMRAFVRGYLARGCGRTTLAAALFAAALSSPRVQRVRPELEAYISQVRQES